ncbi:MAG: DUF962 domain-containing protein [Planctomycetes bacterium]|nr:DUF962 domain-containing protein [Planctomycetota bacterium]
MTMAEFWPFYLGEHRSRANRALHVVGSLGGLVWLGAAAWLSNPWLILPGLINGYAGAWIGHFLIEKNRPATFKYPLKSFLCDWRMIFYVLTGQIGKHLALLPALDATSIPADEVAPQEPVASA